MDQELRNRWLAHAKQQLAEPRRRSGAARTAIIELLARDGQEPLDARQILAWLRDQGVSSASVYRTLHELYKLGLLNRMEGRNGTGLYEIADPDRLSHHFIDERTGTIYSFHDDQLDRAITNAAKRLGIEADGHRLSLRTQLPRAR